MSLDIANPRSARTRSRGNFEKYSWIFMRVSGVFLVFLVLAWRVFRSRSGDARGERNDDGLYDVKAGSKDARNLFAFSILYLTLLFATLLAEHLLCLPAVGAFK